MYAKSPRGLRATWGPDGAPIRNPYREIMSIAYGFFSPLEGFMPWNEVESVLRERRLLSGWLFPFPIVFDVTEEELKASGARPGDDLLLTLRGRPFAVLRVEEVYKLPDRSDFADAVFGTPERNGEVVKKRFDEKHPGWLIYRSLKPLAVAGKAAIINPPRFREPYNRFWTPPAASRKLIEAKGWKVVVAHQTRNVPHIGHEMLMKRAMFVAGGDRPGDAVLVNAIIGAKRPGDYVDEAILEGHEALNTAGYFHHNRHMVTMTLWDMRYGNPLESLLHGVIRQNMGATHHMFGRDHAATGDYYDPYAVHVLWTRGLPSYGIDGCPYEVDRGLRIGAVLLGEFAYCPKCGGWTFLGGLGEGSLCGHVVEGFLALFCGGSLGGPSVAFCGYASWLAWWWIGGVSMGIPSSLLSISSLKARCYEMHRFASRCLVRFRGTPFEGSVRRMLGGGLYVFVLELDGVLGELVLRRFPSARVDARGFVEDLPASFRCVLFEELVARGEVEAAVLAALVASDDGEVPPPWNLLWGFWWGLWGLWLVLAAACFLRLSR